jgi:hypothetical protein
MTPQPPARAGDLLAGRYRLVEHTGTDAGCAHFRARDERLQRDVLVDVATDPTSAGPAADGVRALSGADDTGLHEVLDGGAVAGRPFVVRELVGAPYETTEVLHVGGATAVMPVPLPPAGPEAVPEALERPPRPRREGPRPLVLGLIAAAVVALVLTGLAFGGDGGTVLPTTTTTTAPVRAVRPTRTTVRTAPPTTAPTTTVAPTTTTPTTGADVLPPAGPTGPKEKDPKKTADGGPGPGSAPRA